MANLRINCSQIPNSIAVSAVNSLRGRWFTGKVIITAYIPAAAEGYFANFAVGAAAFRDISEAIESYGQFQTTCNYC